MKDILECAKSYLTQIGLSRVSINDSSGNYPFPILIAETHISEEKPTLLFYAHLDKQPYMDNEKFEKWGGTPPTELRWNEDRSRAYGRGAADDLSGVISIGMAIPIEITPLKSSAAPLPYARDLSSFHLNSVGGVPPHFSNFSLSI